RKKGGLSLAEDDFGGVLIAEIFHRSMLLSVLVVILVVTSFCRYVCGAPLRFVKGDNIKGGRVIRGCGALS
ncbi:MAG: hypothetical protein J6S75_11090, partial [Thermoguttaceae bacterium]|nr:hypothetical protein [Thermoguttaceae bacterium]